MQYKIANVDIEFDRDEKFNVKLNDGKVIVIPKQPIKGNVKDETAKAKQNELKHIIDLIPETIFQLNKQSEKIAQWTKDRF
ncbi:MAG: hypothetical protein IPM04_18490 [Saprospiraceae bacterium]|nr:hypothetical protein [Candidatus Brachybacter algidus]MBK8749733.1 hypothetical protein [Candidatus Brachybacter algidus]